METENEIYAELGRELYECWDNTLFADVKSPEWLALAVAREKLALLRQVKEKE